MYWQIDELQKSLQFVSVSLDGHVLLWTLAKAELQRELLMRLQLQAGQHGQQAGQQHGEGGAAEVAPGGTASGTCIDFSKVGTGCWWRRCWWAAGWRWEDGHARMASTCSSCCTINLRRAGTAGLKTAALIKAAMQLSALPCLRPRHWHSPCVAPLPAPAGSWPGPHVPGGH